MKESLRHIRDTNRVIASSELFLGNKDCPALAIHLAYHIECLPYKSRVVEVFDPRHAHSIAQVFELCVTIPKKEGGS